MSKLIIPYLTDAQRLTITPDSAELIYTTDTNKLYFGDGSTVGGVLYGGIDGADGANGTNGTNGTDGADGAAGAAGADGADANLRKVASTAANNAGWGSLSGATDGTNATFTVPEAGYVAGTLLVYEGDAGIFITQFSSVNPASGTFTLSYNPTNRITAVYEVTAP